MKPNFRLIALITAIVAVPLAVALLPDFPLRLPAALAAAVAVVVLGSYSVTRGLLLPMEKVSEAAKALSVSGAKLNSALPSAGWPEGKSLISSMNRLMLELTAFRAFHLNQVVEDRAKAQALIETIVDGVLLVDHKGHIIYFNRQALALLGIPEGKEKEPLPGSIRTLEFVEAVKEALASQEKTTRAEVQIPGPEGDEDLGRAYMVISRQFMLASLKTSGRVIVLRDITVEREIESARETMFHMITHDMRAPLASIQGYAQLLKRNFKGQEGDAPRFLNIIERSSKRLNGMVEDILNTIKLERGEQELRAAQVDCGALCAETVEVYDPVAAKKKITLAAGVPAEKLMLDADAALLDRVIANLVGNALKFTPAQGKVTLSCRADGDHALFCVEDTGPGVPAEKQGFIFEKYGQQDEHKFMGFGLGLTMCKMVADLHKGRIWVESDGRTGSRFLLRLPLKQGQG